MKMANNTTKVEDAKRDIHLRVVIVRNNVVVITCWINVGDAEKMLGAGLRCVGGGANATYVPTYVATVGTCTYWPPPARPFCLLVDAMSPHSFTQINHGVAPNIYPRCSSFCGTRDAAVFSEGTADESSFGSR